MLEVIHLCCPQIHTMISVNHKMLLHNHHASMMEKYSASWGILRFFYWYLFRVHLSSFFLYFVEELKTPIFGTLFASFFPKLIFNSIVSVIIISWQDILSIFWYHCIEDAIVILNNLRLLRLIFYLKLLLGNPQKWNTSCCEDTLCSIKAGCAGIFEWNQNYVKS